jgi:membrane protease YdiL (CAAX protease family)
MRRTPLSRGRARAATAPGTYWTRSTRPLHVLLFLVPLIALYEVGSAMYLVDVQAAVERTVLAKKLFADLFNLFGVAGAFMPGLALAAVLLVWHVMSRDPWKVDPGTLATMLFESALWTLPLLVIMAVAGQMAHVGPGSAAHVVALAAGDPAPGIGANLTISIGAGLYEEMLFRLVGLALLHFVLVDLVGMPHRWGSAAAIVLSAVAFAAYHQPHLPQEWGKVVFYVLSGVYLGTVYAVRGFGIAVGTHALYDVLVLVVLAPTAGVAAG